MTRSSNSSTTSLSHSHIFILYIIWNTPIATREFQILFFLFKRKTTPGLIYKTENSLHRIQIHLSLVGYQKKNITDPNLYITCTYVIPFKYSYYSSIVTDIRYPDIMYIYRQNISQISSLQQYNLVLNFNFNLTSENKLDLNLKSYNN